MEIERLWGRAPGWFMRQPREHKARLLAWYRVHLNPTAQPDNIAPMRSGAPLKRGS